MRKGFYTKRPVFNRFMNKIIVNQENGCWEWNGCKDKNGYGRININGKMISTHRFSFEHFKGEIPNGMCILHSCDNPKCANPDHLRIGTQFENMRDKISKGRGNFKLSEKQIAEIKKRLSNNEKQIDIAKDFNVSCCHISNIKNNRKWSYLESI